MNKTKKLLLALVVGLAAFAGLKATGSMKPETVPPQKETTKTTIVHLTKAEFLKKVADYEKEPEKWKYLGKQPAIVDFYADWCGPCRQIAPLLEQLAGEYKGKIVVYKINVDNEKELAAAFGISSIPTLLFIPMEGTPKVTLGAQPKEELKKTIDTFLLGKKK